MSPMRICLIRGAIHCNITYHIVCTCIMCRREGKEKKRKGTKEDIRGGVQGYIFFKKFQSKNDTNTVLVCMHLVYLMIETTTTTTTITYSGSFGLLTQRVCLTSKSLLISSSTSKESSLQSISQSCTFM